MPNFICSTCGTQYPESGSPPERCGICADERQFVSWSGQHWTTLDGLIRSHRNTVRLEAPQLYGIGIEPAFAIGQRALLISHPNGNVLWDCIPLLDPGLVELIHGIGGISAIAISHPHYYSSMVEWAQAFDCDVLLHLDDRAWVQRSDRRLVFWEGDQHQIADGLTLIRCGGHFDGGTVLHWRQGANGKGVVLSGDILQVVQDRRWVSFMYSYPNLIPLSAESVRRVLSALEGFRYEQIYGAWWDKMVSTDAEVAVHKSAKRYLSAIEGDRTRSDNG